MYHTRIERWWERVQINPLFISFALTKKLNTENVIEKEKEWVKEKEEKNKRKCTSVCLSDIIN